MPSTLHEWWRQPDHYYWLTAFLAARGAQTRTCKLIAGSLAGLAIVSAISLAFPSGPVNPYSQAATLAITAACIALSLSWLRRTWPSRRQSVLFVLVAAAWISAACLIQTDPLAGLFGCTAFAVLAGYIAFFHTPRLMVLNLAIAAVTSVVLAYRMAADGALAKAIATVLFLTVVNLAIPLACQALVHLLGINVLNTDIDPLTGLLNRESFIRTSAALIASRNRDDDRYLVLLLIDLDNFSLLTHTDGRMSGERARVAVAQTLRETTRHNAVLAHVPDPEFLIADSFPTTDCTPLVERVKSAIRTTPPRTTASIGVVSTPMQGLAQLPPEDVLEELIHVARSAMRHARRSGGNQAHYIVCPTLNAFDEDEPPR